MVRVVIYPFGFKV